MLCTCELLVQMRPRLRLDITRLHIKSNQRTPQHFSPAINMSDSYYLLHINDGFIAIGYIGVSIGIVRFVTNSEVVKKIKSNSNLISLYKQIALNTFCFAVTFFLCGITHVITHI